MQNAELIEHLRKDRRYAVEKTGHGIYNVRGDILPMQLIDSRELTEGENLWLKNLSNRLDGMKIRRLSIEADKRGKMAQLLAYMQVIARANHEAIKEAIMIEDRALEKIFEEVGWIAKWEAKGEAVGEARGEAKRRALERQHFLELLDQGLSPEEIKLHLA
jgi:hypothetical protein